MMLFLVIVCGGVSIAYGAWAIRSVLAADAGNARMQEIAAAIQEGAGAYLRRQYTAIAVAGRAALRACRTEAPAWVRAWTCETAWRACRALETASAWPFRRIHRQALAERSRADVRKLCRVMSANV